jgi:hypothetical protein
MSADISAHTFQPSKQFDAVVIGQGEVLVDSVLNEQEAIARHRSALTAADTIGVAGAPKANAGFAVSVSPDGKDLLLSTGRIYVDGVVCVNEPDIVGATVVSPTAVAVDVAAPDGVNFALGQWVDVLTGANRQRVQLAAVNGQQLSFGTAPAGLPAAGGPVRVQPVTSLRSQPNRFPVNPFDLSDPEHVVGGAYRVEADVWHREISCVQDPTIREVALGDADSASRLKVIWQLRLVAAGPAGGGSCATALPGAPGLLAASTVPGLPADDPCELPDEAGYRGLENQLYRVEVHSVSSTELVLKWQRDNASTASRVVALGSTVQLADMGRDDERGFVTAPYVEITDEHLELEQLPSDLIAVQIAENASRTLKLAAAPTQAQQTRRPQARRWDGMFTIDLVSPGARDPVVLERGVQVAITPGALLPGDYWQIAARTSNSVGGGTITWPSADDGTAIAQPPYGIEHHRTGLALVDTDGLQFLSGASNLRDCRVQFPSLTTIAATDVSVDPTACEFVGVSNVQQAIDALCARGSGGACTVTATPGPGWESVFNQIPAGADARICFPLGTYPTATAVVVANKGHLQLHGVGMGSLLVGSSTEAVVAFRDCSAVSIQSLAVESASTAIVAGGLAGALTFNGCQEVTVTDCTLTTAGKLIRSSSCLWVAGGIVRVENNVFGVGDCQIGVLVTDASRTTVRGNRFSVSGPPAAGDGPATPLERQQARRLLIADLKKSAAAGRIPIKIGNSAMSFQTAPAVAGAWPVLLPASFATMNHFQKAVDKVMRGVFAGHPAAGAATLANFVDDRILSRRVAVMAQAVVVGGQTVGDIVIDSNTVDAAIQGIHIGASSASQPRGGPAESVGAVAVSGNKIGVLVPPEGARARHAIFIGNADRVRVTNNDMSFDGRAEGDPIASDGIRIFGFIGRLMTLRDNMVESFPGGISLHLLMGKGGGQLGLARMWAVEDNMIVGANTPVTLDGPLKAQVKFRGNKPGPSDN